MSPDSTAQEKARQELIILKSTQNTIVNEIVLRDGTMRKKINELADILAERIDRLDPEMEGIGLEQISSTITRILKEKNCSIANWVRDYLPPKYKNPNMARVDNTINKINEICAALPRKLPEDCSMSELQDLYDTTTELKNENDKSSTYFNKVQERIEYTAYQKGFQLNGDKFRRQISHEDFDEDVPLSIRERVERNVELFKSIGKGFIDIADKYLHAPPRTEEELDEDYNVLQTFDIVLQPYHDLKSTGDIIHAFERQYISDLHGKHAAGNSDKFPTKLCIECSVIDDKNPNPDDYEVLIYDTTSSTHYRCMKCGGTESIDRGMSREQVGDSQAVTMRKAQNVIKFMPLLGITLHRWNKNYIQPKEDSRKVVISQFFSRSAIAGKDYTVVKAASDK